MARDDAPPFGRGETFYNGGVIDPNNLGGLNLEGQIRVFEDEDLTPGNVGAKSIRSGRPVKCMIVRNVATIPLLPKRLVTLQKSGTDPKYYLGRVDGYAAQHGVRCYPVDEYLPAAGVPINDLFWIVIEGPAKVTTDLNADATNVINVGDVVTAMTAANSLGVTAGRVKQQDLTGATAPFANEVANQVGHALGAATTGNTGADLLCEIGEW